MSSDNNDDNKPEDFAFPEPSGPGGALPAHLPTSSEEPERQGGYEIDPTLKERFPRVMPGEQLIKPDEDSLYIQSSSDVGAVSNQFSSADVNAAVESTALKFNSGLKSDRSLCETCIHCWSMRKEAVTLNLGPDGKPFMAREAFCTVNAQSLFTLNDRNVLECNKYEGGGKPRTTLEDI